jgi:DNA-directed RNA polymerase subunit F
MTTKYQIVGSSNVKSIKNSKNVYAASQAGDDFKKIFVSYASEGNIKDLKNDMILEGKQDSKKVYAEDLKKILAARPRSEENLKEISVSYGSKLEAGVKEIFVSYGSEGGQDSKKASVVDLEKILAARPRNEENLNRFFASYGSKLEEDLKEISVSYGSDGEEDLKNISASYGIKGEEGVKEISVSYGGQEDEAGLNKISASEGEKGGL